MFTKFKKLICKIIGHMDEELMEYPGVFRCSLCGRYKSEDKEAVKWLQQQK